MAEKKKIRRIGILTSGGDAPGMNAVIRAVTRMSIANDIEVLGIFRCLLWQICCRTTT